MVGPETQTCPLIAVQARWPSWPWVEAQATWTRMALWRHGPQTPMWPHVAAQAFASSWPLVVTGPISINADHSCRQGHGSRHALGSSPGLDITMAPGGKQDYHISWFLATFTAMDLPFSTEHKPFCLSLPYPSIHLPAIKASNYLWPQGRPLASSHQPRENYPGQHM